MISNLSTSISKHKDHRELPKVKEHSNVGTTFQFLTHQILASKNVTLRNMLFLSYKKFEKNVIHCKSPLQDKTKKRKKVLSGIVTHHHFDSFCNI